jgi:D-3-phosphoglycerate dehydrogenase
MKPLVLLTHTIHPDAMRRLAEEAEVQVATATDEASLCAQIAQASAVIVRTPLTPAVIRAGTQLKVVARHGVGLDYIPVATCTELGIPVVFTPNANTESVAEHAVGAMIALAHYFGPADRAVRGHAWARREGMIGLDLSGRTLGILGMGRIGTRVAEICRAAFNMRVLGYDPFLTSEAIGARGAAPAALNEVLEQSEFLTLHMPLSDLTRHILNADTFSHVRQGVFLINAARGGLLDTAALAEAMRAGRVRGAALDVLEDEPPLQDNPLLSIDNIIFTPHSAALTEEALLRMGMDASEDVLRVLRGEAPLNCANPATLRGVQ